MTARRPTNDCFSSVARCVAPILSAGWLPLRLTGSVLEWRGVDRLRIMDAAARVVIVADVGSAGADHVGDNAMFEANVAALSQRLRRLEVTLLARRPYRSESLPVVELPGLAFPPLEDASDGERHELLRQVGAAARGGGFTALGCRAESVAALVAALSQADALIVSGGGNLNARWPEHLFERAAAVEVAHSLGKPVAFLGQTLGPALGSDQRVVLGEALGRAVWVGVRELPSAALALALGVPQDRLDYQLDDAWLLPPRPPEPAERRLLPEWGSGPWIALTVHPFAAPTEVAVERIGEQLGALATALGARLLFVPHEAADDAGQSDVLISRALVSRLPRQVESWICPVLPPRLVRWVTAQASLVVSTRYHPLVFGLAAGVPCLGLWADGYSRVKVQGALRHAGQSEWSLSLAEGEAGVLLSRGLDLWRRREETSAHLVAQQPVWREREERRWARLVASLGLSGSPAMPSGSSTGGAEPALEPSGSLLGAEPRALALALLETLEEERAAAGAELERRRAELRWVVGTSTWKLRSRLLGLRPLLSAYRALHRPTISPR